MEVVRLREVGVTQTTVTIEWTWQKKSRPIRVQSYTVALRTDSETQGGFKWLSLSPIVIISGCYVVSVFVFMLHEQY